MDIQKRASLRAFLEEHENVLLAFVFGSAAEGRLRDESDFDTAILFREKPPFSALKDIMDNVSRLTERESDIVVLNDSSPVIRMQVLKKGLLIKKINDKVYNEFFLRTVKEYDDLKQTRKEQEDNILKGRIYA